MENMRTWFIALEGFQQTRSSIAMIKIFEKTPVNELRIY